MATYSYVLYAANGSQRDFTFPFTYLDKAHIRVSVDGAAAPFSFINDSTVRLDTTPANGTVIEIKRETVQTFAPVDFTDGSVLREVDLDRLVLFATYAAQESLDANLRSIFQKANGAYTAKNFRLSDVADPVDANDVVTKNYFENVYTAQLDARIQSAQDASASAVAAKGIAETAATNAGTARDTAVSAKDIAVGAKDTAVTKAAEVSLNTSTTNQAKTDAVNAKVAAETARDGAATAKEQAETARDASVTAKGQAETAVTNATNAKTASETARDLAQSWASKTGSAVDVANNLWSAKAYAGDSLIYRNLAQNWASQASGTVDGVSYSAKYYATLAQTAAASINDSNLVHRSGDETIAGVKSFTTSPIFFGNTYNVPTAVVDFDGGGAGTFEVRNHSNGGAALMNFHRNGVYALKMGLDTSNVFRIGGWSQGNFVYRFSSDTNGNCTAASFNGVSDMRLKKDFGELVGVVPKLAELPVFSYTSTQFDNRLLGTSAQEVQKLFPEAVNVDADGWLSLSYGNLALVGVIELAKEVVKLRDELNALKGTTS